METRRPEWILLGFLAFLPPVLMAFLSLRQGFRAIELAHLMMSPACNIAGARGCDLDLCVPYGAGAWYRSLIRMGIPVSVELVTMLHAQIPTLFLAPSAIGGFLFFRRNEVRWLVLAFGWLVGLVGMIVVGFMFVE